MDDNLEPVTLNLEPDFVHGQHGWVSGIKIYANIQCSCGEKNHVRISLSKNDLEELKEYILSVES
jgi:hypothetical protein